MTSLSDKQILLIVKALGWRLEYMLEYPDLGDEYEASDLSSLIDSFGFVTSGDGESGEISIIKLKSKANLYQC